MSTYDERLAALEQTTSSLRNDFLQAIIENTRSMSTLNKVVLQQEQNARDANHEITILMGVISSRGHDIKDIKNRLDGFDQRLASIDQRLTSFDQQFVSIDQRLASFDQRFTSFDQQFASIDQRFVSIEGKLEQVLQLLTTPPRTDK